MSDLKLVYFDLRGRAEMIRLMLAAAGKEYEEQRIALGTNWPEIKPTTPFGTVPYIVYKGKSHGLSTAIGPFLAKELGFCGQSNEDLCRILEVAGLWEDQMTSAIIKYRWTKDEAEKAKALSQALDVDLPRYFGYYERFLKENQSTGYVVGNSLSLADFYVYDMVDNILQLKKDVLEKYPLLKKLRQNVEADPKVKAYLASRKETIF